MNFEWDESKSEACFRERGFDFAYAARAFFDPERLVRADTRYGYGEERFELLGKIKSPLRRHRHISLRNDAHHFRPQGQPR